MKRTYTVSPASPFILYFKNTEDYRTFMNEYSAAEGFSFIRSEKGYRLFTNSHSYNAYRFVDKKEPGNPSIGIGISSCDPVYQRITLDIALKAVRVRGLDSYHACYKGLSRQPIHSNGAPAFFRYVEEYFDCATEEITEGDADDDGYLDFIETYEEIVELEEEFSLRDPFFAEYSDIQSVQQNDNDGVVYKFITKATSGEPKAKTMVKVTMDDGSSVFNASIAGHDKSGVYLRFSKNSSFSYTQSSSFGTITEKANVEYPLKKKALKALKSNSCTNKKILDVIVGKKLLPLKIEKEYSPFDSEGNLTVRVTPSQTDAIKKALNTKDFLLVQGPPGTGKTTIITEMVKSFVKDGLRVLISSKNNLPVDNVIEKCKDLYHDGASEGKMLCLRLGQEENVLSSVRSQLSRPLALSIENDVKKRSVKAREDRLSHESSVFEKCVAAEAALLPFRGLVYFFADQNELYREIEKSFTHTLKSFFFSLFLGKKRRETIKKSLADAKEHSQAILLLLTEPFKYESYSVSEGYMQSLLLSVNSFFDAIDSINREITSAKKRYKGAFEGLYDKACASTADADTKKIAFANDIEKAMISFSGNAAADIFSEYSKASPADSFKKFVSALSEAKNRAEATKIRFQSILDEWHEELASDQKIVEDPLVQCVKIIGATCIGVNTTPALANAEYDVAIIDEAGQITAYDLLVPLVKARKIILIGDHLQLPPSGNNDFCKHIEKNDLFNFEDSATVTNIKELKETYSISLFEKLFRDTAFDKNKVMLDTQFRMNPVIAEFISESFYDGKYKSGVTESDRTLCIGGFTKPLYFIDTVNSPNKHEYMQKDEELIKSVTTDDEDDDNDKNFTNDLEAKILADCVTRIIVDIENGTFHGSCEKLKDKNGDYDIGVITAYKNQIKVITDCIRERLLNYYNDAQTDEILSHLSVNTLDSFQGRDNQIIFYSFVRSNPQNKIGFLNELRRINVMMTRAKSLLIMIGDSETLTKSKKRAIHSGESTGDFYKKLIKYCKEKNGYILADK